jgi:sugar diacid utilization regulator
MMNLSTEIANKIVDVIYNSCGYHCIVGDQNGMIIADSARQRIGLVHKGQVRILNSGIDEITVTKEQELAFGGTDKEGYNIAIKHQDRKIGCFGIAGSLEIVTPIAKVAAGMVTTMIRDEELRNALREQVEKLNQSIEIVASAVEEVAASSQEVAAISQTVANAVLEGQEQVKKTTNIIDFIRRVAVQTNLLGLNAAIEAARAGEHGKGFSVVADEVRKLAVESNRSTDEIDQILTQFEEVIASISEGVSQNNAVIQEQAKATQDITGIVQTVQQVGFDLDSIATQL